MRALLAIALVGCTSSGAEPPLECGAGAVLDRDACVAPAMPCGPSTQEVNGECVPATVYTIRANATLAADVDDDLQNGPRLDVVVSGRHPDGSVATERVVLNTDRAAAGTFDPPVLELGELHSVARFQPCRASTPGCVGPVALTVALESAPATPVATFPAAITPPDTIGSIEHCKTGGNVLYLEGNRYVQRGALTVVNGVFARAGGTKRGEVTITPSDPKQGKKWTVEFSSVELGTLLEPGVYRNAVQSPPLGSPLIRVFGESPFSYCAFSWLGEFQIHEYVFTTTLQKMTASFRQWCGNESNPDHVVTGCIHVE